MAECEDELTNDNSSLTPYLDVPTVYKVLCKA